MSKLAFELVIMFSSCGYDVYATPPPPFTPSQIECINEKAALTKNPCMMCLSAACPDVDCTTAERAEEINTCGLPPANAAPTSPNVAGVGAFLRLASERGFRG